MAWLGIGLGSFTGVGRTWKWRLEVVVVIGIRDIVECILVVYFGCVFIQ